MRLGGEVRVDGYRLQRKGREPWYKYGGGREDEKKETEGDGWMESSLQVYVLSGFATDSSYIPRPRRDDVRGIPVSSHRCQGACLSHPRSTAGILVGSTLSTTVCTRGNMQNTRQHSTRPPVFSRRGGGSP